MRIGQAKKDMRNIVSWVIVKLAHQTLPKGDISLMSKSITQDMAYRQSLMKYAEKYGVSRAMRVIHVIRSALRPAPSALRPVPSTSGTARSFFVSRAYAFARCALHPVSCTLSFRALCPASCAPRLCFRRCVLHPASCAMPSALSSSPAPVPNSRRSSPAPCVPHPLALYTARLRPAPSVLHSARALSSSPAPVLSPGAPRTPCRASQRSRFPCRKYPFFEI